MHVTIRVSTSPSTTSPSTPSSASSSTTTLHLTHPPASFSLLQKLIAQDHGIPVDRQSWVVDGRTISKDEEEGCWKEWAQEGAGWNIQVLDNAAASPTQTTSQVPIPIPSPSKAQPTPSPVAPVVVLKPLVAKRRTLPCAHRPCSHPPLRIAGQCRYCTHTYCAKHRLPETHACQELGTCRQQAVQKLGQRLMGEKCVASKM